MRKGAEYEVFVQTLQQAILDSEPLFKQKNIQVERNKKLQDSRGILREFDLYWEYDLAGYVYKNVIECKNYASNISIEKIDAFIGKLLDFPDLKPIFATKMGYQKGAKEKAIKHKIDLLIVREQDSTKDWTDKDGTPLLREIHIGINMNCPPRILDFRPTLDRQWFEANDSINVSELSFLSGLTNEIIIEDIDKNETYSLHELTCKATNLPFGKSTKRMDFAEGYLITKFNKMKMTSCEIDFIQSEPFKMSNVIDFSKELIGVIEYLNGGKKKAILRSGVVKDR
ncbi:hypothetical protein A9Q97_03270 [Rhodospirillales bacterium 47_12_T64]|nr:hypothetical protein A9Q97_03270 [Rhodospirillales bacterium 47_12_T64]